MKKRLYYVEGGLATAEDIAWVRPMGGIIPEEVLYA